MEKQDNQMAARLSWLKQIRAQRHPAQATLPMATPGFRARLAQKRVKRPWTAGYCSLPCLVRKSRCPQTSPNMTGSKTSKNILLITLQLDVFGREVDFVHPTTQAYLEDSPLCFEIASKPSKPTRALKTVHTETSRKQSRFQPMRRGLSHPALSLRSRECAMSSLKQAYMLLGQELGRTVVPSESLRCRTRLRALKKAPFEGATGSTA